MPIATINPASGETLRTFEALSSAQIERRIARAAETYESFRRTPLRERLACLQRAAELLEAQKEELGRLMTLEMGKPLKAAMEEAAKCAWACRYYVENGERFLQDRVVQTSATRSFVRYQPVGPVLAIMPWNFPFWQVFRFAAPALTAGNVGLLKHASNVPQCALAIENIFLEAGFPPGAFQTLLIGSDQVEQVIQDPRVRAVTLTGSTPAGSAVAAQAGKLIKKTVLELGGSDPFIVMPSADLDKAVTTAVKARVINNGQSCIAAKRFIVHDQIYPEFERRFVEGMQALRVGDPADLNIDLGPVATQSILADLERQVQTSVEQGARLLLGGGRLDRPGFYFSPTVLADIPRGSPAYQEEVFGPVAMLHRVRDIDEAIHLANDTPFGLGAAAWTRDPGEQERFINEIQAGMVFINAMVASDPRLPFGGVKESGYGRELTELGMYEFMNIKTIWIQEDGEARQTGTE